MAKIKDITGQKFGRLTVIKLHHKKKYKHGSKLCQFCKLRGRLNHPEGCIGKENAMCNDYEEIEHIL